MENQVQDEERESVVQDITSNMAIATVQKGGKEKSQVGFVYVYLADFGKDRSFYSMAFVWKNGRRENRAYLLKTFKEYDAHQVSRDLQDFCRRLDRGDLVIKLD
mgnify:CR=1 FL=1